MRTKHTRRAKRSKRQAAVDAAADVYWRGKLAEYQDCLRRARAAHALPESEERTAATLGIMDELDGWLDLMEEIGIF